ncbi:small, acid-soluble spore protein tlp [Ruminiclostridium papyrosolvens DSM 2782]|uniref:Protein Tlp homolog n=1 Tax=Ruminiclostridium papyrosolvens DSM 2782 TaxID=588581 RepID=F1TC03_9FIRM|nr:small acid-soluble spore protein Tlp [Ruminiclostridium papyrosolvens]EGD47918.1 small, acid-soluble spore protein tlp [Ruminiclostridium papyrosolvens DSM 2782]WES35188.1 small acid-soluble spore protein Tlp [Ruminiclostridium papyrosolvens DSM 2782]
MNKPKPDDRSDNVKRIQANINYTIKNIELADELIEKTDDSKMAKTLEEKNDRRRDALEGFRAEIRDEALDQKRRGK